IYVARAGWDDQEIAVSTINDVPRLGETPHTLVIPGLLNPVEMDYLVYVLNADRDLVMRHQKWVSELIKKYNNTSG
ncbi:MAG: diphthine synthase, partial [Vulcanisaeta sp.]|nr:diphthine synthase [Vulcanisaeta sp.]